MSARIVRVVLPVLILAAGIGGMTALVKSKPERAPLEAEERAWTVAVVTIEPGTVTPQLVLFARVDSPRIAQLSSAVTADVETVDVLEGQRANQDDRLLALDDREIRLVLAQRDAELAEFEADLEHERLRHRNNLAAMEHENALLELVRREVSRARDLADRGVGSQASLDQVRRDEKRQMLAVEQRRLAIREHESRRKQIEAKLARATAQQAQAMLDLERTRVYPPFEGRITEVLVSPGDRVRPGDRHARHVRHRDVGAPRPDPDTPPAGGACRPWNAARPWSRGQRWTAGKSAPSCIGSPLVSTPGSGGADGLFRVTEGNAWLQIGRTVEIILDLPPIHDAVAVSREALYGTDRVFVLDGERMKSIAVERLGEIHAGDGAGRLILRSPHLEASDRMIVTHLPNAIDGLKVKEAGAAAE